MYKYHLVLFFVLVILTYEATLQQKKGNEHFKLKAIANHLPYQAHSFNDLNYTRNLLLKRTRYFKFDVSLANKVSCQKYSTWNNANPCFNSSNYAEEICCIAMRGDASSEPDFNYPFNTTTQFIVLLDWFLHNYQTQIPILFVAIDFQFRFEFKNKLAEDFVHQLSLLLAKYPKLQVTIANDFILQFDKICLNWSPKDNKDFVLQSGDDKCNPIRKEISKSRIFLQTSAKQPSDPRDYFNRYKNFNVIYKQIDNLCANGFPNWINKYPEFPLIFWQPSNEQQIQTALAKLFTPHCRREHNRTIQGIAFASNIDPQIFQIFMKPLTPSSIFEWNYLQNKLWLQNVRSVKLSKMIDNGIEKIVVYWQTNIEDKKHYLGILNKKDSGTFIYLENYREIDQEVVELHATTDKIITISVKNPSTSRDFDANLNLYNGKLESVTKTYIAKYITSYSTNNLIYLLVRSSNPTYLNLFSTSDLKSVTPYLSALYMSMDQIESITSMYFLKADTDVLLMLGNQNKQTWISQFTKDHIHKTKIITYGTKANIVQKQPGTVVITLENSYCHSGLLLNNNAENKCLLHNTEALMGLAALRGLVNILQSKLTDLLAFIDNQSTDIVTACTQNIDFSKHLNGESVDIVSIWGQNFIAAKYLPLNQQELMMSLFSGGSNYDKKLLNTTGFILTSVNSQNKLGASGPSFTKVRSDQ